MATASKDKKGIRIRFYHNDKRHTFRPGVPTLRQAQQIATYIDRISGARSANQPLDTMTAQWVSELPDKLHSKLVKYGLLQPRNTVPTLKELTDLILERGETLSGEPAAQNTIANWRTASNHLLAHFGDLPVDKILPRDAAAFYHEMQKTLAVNSARKVIACAKAFYRHGHKLDLFSVAPFKSVVSRSIQVKDRQYFVTPEQYQQLLKASHTNQWRLLLALGRYGGLRIPSEAADMQWEDLREDRFVVRIPKTSHHEGKAIREVPMFPEIKEEFDRLGRKVSGPIFSMSLNDSNMSSRLSRLIVQAGMEPWPKPWHNMRSTRRTELQNEGILSHVLNCWLGHSEEVAQGYLQVPDGEFESASKVAPKSTPSACDFLAVLASLDSLSTNEIAEIHAKAGKLLEG